MPGSRRAAGRPSSSSAPSGRRWRRAARPAACDHRRRQDLRRLARRAAGFRCAADAPGGKRPEAAPPLTVLWITPMRALAADTLRALQQALDAARRRCTVERRRCARGDTGSARAQRAEPAPADGARHDAREPVAAARARRCRARCSARCAWWSSTNGTSCSATSAACRCSWRWRVCGAGTDRLCVWGMSATLGNLDEAHAHACWAARAGPAGAGRAAEEAGRRLAAARPGRALSVGRPPGPHDAAAGDRGDRRQQPPRWSSPTRARSPRSGTRRCWRRGPTGPA